MKILMNKKYIYIYTGITEKNYYMLFFIISWVSTLVLCLRICSSNCFDGALSSKYASGCSYSG